MQSAQVVLAFALLGFVAGSCGAQTEWILDPGEPVLDNTTNDPTTILAR